MATKVRAIITGATGMVGEGVLHECLNHPDVEKVLVLGRKSCGVTHPKLTEVLQKDLYDITPIEKQLTGYNACFFCLGTTSVGKSNDEYYKSTYTLTLHVAQVLSRVNTGMVFNYVSGAGTDSSEKGTGWAAVKGKVENDIAKLPFAKTYAFRPGFIKPTPGLKNTHSFYKYINWVFPIGRAIAPNGFCTLQELGLAMIHSVTRGYPKHILEGKDIIALARE